MVDRATAPMAEALPEHAGQLAGEVLAVAVHAGETGPGTAVDGPEGSRFWLAKA